MNGAQVVRTLGNLEELNLTEARQAREDGKVSNRQTSKEARAQASANDYWMAFAAYMIGDRPNLKRPNLKVSEGTRSDYYRWVENLVKLSNPEGREERSRRLVQERNERKHLHSALKAVSTEDRLRNVKYWVDTSNATIPASKKDWKGLLTCIGQDFGYEVMRKCAIIIGVFSGSEVGEDFHPGKIEIRIGELGVQKRQTTRTNAEGNFVALTSDIRDFRKFVLAAQEDFEKSGSVVTASILCAVYLPLRRSEWFRLSWEDVDLEALAISIRTSKAGISVLHPISSRLAHVLEALKDGKEAPGLVFSGRFGQIVSNGAPSVKIHQLGYRGKQTFHGLRACFETYINDHYEDVFGSPRQPAIDMTLHHTSKNSLGKAYQRSALLEERRGLLEKWAEFVQPK